MSIATMHQCHHMAMGFVEPQPGTHVSLFWYLAVMWVLVYSIQIIPFGKMLGKFYFSPVTSIICSFVHQG